MRLKEIIIERVGDDLWYHGSPDMRGLDGQFELRQHSISYISDPDLWDQVQIQMDQARAKDGTGDEYFRLLKQAGNLRKSKQVTKPIFLSNNRRVAQTYANDKPAFDYQDSEPGVVSVKTIPGKTLTINGHGEAFSGIPVGAIYRGLITAGFSKEEIDLVFRHYPHELRRKETVMSTDGLTAIVQEMGFDTVDVINVRDNYTGVGPAATVRAIFDPDRIQIQRPGMNEDTTFAGATYMHVETGKLMKPDGTHAAVVWGASGEDEAREDALYDEIADGDWVAGFLTSEGKFLTRKEAAKTVDDDQITQLDTDDNAFQIRWIEEDYQWTKPNTTRIADAGAMVARASFNVGKNTYLVEIYDLSSHARVYGFGDELFQVGFRPANDDEYEGNRRSGNESNPRAVINGVKQIMIDWVREHKPKVIIAGSPDEQKNRIFKYLAQRSQGVMDQLGYSSRPFMNMGVVFIKNEEVTEMEQDDGHDEHGVALAQTGYWGKAGAGCIIMANDTKRVLIPLRSEWVEQPGTWGTWGGAIDPGEAPKDAAMREVREEAGYPGEVLAIEPLFRYQDESFRYDTFLVVVAEEFQAKLNWETERADWFKIGQWPSPLHFGLEAVLKDSSAKNKIGRAGS